MDDMSNSFNNAYAAWPDSAYVIHDGKLVYRSQLEDEGYRAQPFAVQIEALLNALEKEEKAP